MDKLIYVVLVVGLLLLVFAWPKKKRPGKNAAQDEFGEEVTEDFEMEPIDGKQKGKEPAKKQLAKKVVKENSGDKAGSNKVKKAPAKKALVKKAPAKQAPVAKPPTRKQAKRQTNEIQGGANKAMDRKLSQPQEELSDEELLNGYSDSSASQALYKEAEAQSGPAGSQGAQAEQMPEIKMDTEEAVSLNRVRKKRVSETDKKEDNTAAFTGIHFEADELHKFETPQLDDLFGGPDINGENYKDKLFEQIDDIDETEFYGLDSEVSGIQQVSEDLEVHTTAPEPQVETVPLPAENIGIAAQTLMTQETSIPVTHETSAATKPISETHKTPAATIPQVTAQRTSAASAPVTAQRTPATSAIPKSDPIVSETKTVKLASVTDSESNTLNVEEPASNSGEVQPSIEREPMPAVIKPHEGLRFRKRTNTKKATELLPSEIDVRAETSDLSLIFESPDVKQPVEKNGLLTLFNSHVYKNGNATPWDIRYEIQLRNGEEAVVDTGIGIRVPQGIGIKLVTNADLKDKFGLELVSPELVSRLEAAYSLKFTVRGVQAAAYIAKNQSLVSLKIFRI